MKYVGQKAHESKDIKPQSFDPKLRCKNSTRERVLSIIIFGGQIPYSFHPQRP